MKNIKNRPSYNLIYKTNSLKDNHILNKCLKSIMNQLFTIFQNTHQNEKIDTS